MNMIPFGGNFNNPVTMSSREIADLCEKRHADVMRDIRQMLGQITERSFAPSDFEATYTDPTGRKLPEYRLPKDLTVTLITGCRADLRYKVDQAAGGTGRARGGIERPAAYGCRADRG